MPGLLAVRPALLRHVVAAATRVGNSRALVLAKLKSVVLDRDTADSGGVAAAMRGNVRDRACHRPGNAAANVDRAAAAFLGESLLRWGDTNHGQRQTHCRYAGHQDTPRADNRSGVQSVHHFLKHPSLLRPKPPATTSGARSYPD